MSRDTGEKVCGLQNLGGHPTHYGYGTDGVLRTALDHAIAIGHVHEYVPTAIKESHHVQLLEQKTASLVEHSLTILQITRDMDRTDLAAGDTDIAGVFRHSQRAFDAASNRSADVAGNPLHFRIIEPVYRDPIVGPP